MLYDSCFIGGYNLGDSLWDDVMQKSLGKPMLDIGT
jgi:hypothetical protein